MDPRPPNNDMRYGEYLRTFKHMRFIPMAFESSGAVGTTFFPVLRLVSEIYNEENKYEQARFRVKWRRTIGMAVHKGVAKRFLLSLDEHLGVAGKCFASPHPTGYDDLRLTNACLLYTSPSPRDRQKSRMPSSA